MATFRMRILYHFKYSQQICLVPNPSGQILVVLGRRFSVTRNGLCASVLLNILDTKILIQRGRKLGYALPMRADYRETPNLKRHRVKNCPTHANKDLILKRIKELKSLNKIFSMRPETDDACRGARTFQNAPRQINWILTNQFCQR